MRLRANEVDYTQIMVKGIPSLFTETRVVRDSVPEGFYLYEVRCDDDGLGDPSQIGSCVITNFLGSLLHGSKKNQRIDSERIPGATKGRRN